MTQPPQQPTILSVDAYTELMYRIPQSRIDALPQHDHTVPVCGQCVALQWYVAGLDDTLDDLDEKLDVVGDTIDTVFSQLRATVSRDDLPRLPAPVERVQGEIVDDHSNP